MRAARPLLVVTLFSIFGLSAGVASAQWLDQPKPDGGPSFGPLSQWQAAVASSNASQLKSLYSTDPPARITTKAGDLTPDADIAFWTGLKASKIKLDVMQSTSPQPGAQQVVFQAEVVSQSGGRPQTLYVVDGQLWQQQQGQWRLVASKRSDPAKLQQPASLDKQIYAPEVNAREEVKEALARAAKQHKRVLVVFGANWCYDCHVLDMAFHRPDLAGVLNQNFEVVHVDVGRGEKNQDLMQEYQVPMAKGIPALAVLDSNGKLLYSQKGGEFENARSLSPDDLLKFLNKWKPAAG